MVALVYTQVAHSSIFQASALAASYIAAAASIFYRERTTVHVCYSLN